MSTEGEFVRWEGAPPPTRGELLTDQFYLWEKRGRGWQLWDYPVELEPPFRPFLFHDSMGVVPILDDGRKPTLLGSLWDRMRGRGNILLAPVVPSGEDLERNPEPFEDDSEIIEFQLSIPPTLKVTREATEQLLLSLSYTSRPLSFEVIGEAGGVTVQIACREPDAPELRQQLHAHFPEAVLAENAGTIAKCWDGSRARETVVVDFGLSHEFMLPLRTFRGFEVDPLIALVGALSHLREGELGVLQLLFQTVRHPWTESVLRSVTDWEGREFFIDAPEMVSQAREKMSRPLFAAVVRVAAQSVVHGRAWQIAKGLGGALRQFANPTSNELIPLSNDGYDESEHHRDLLSRRTHRSGMILNSEELVSLVHLPSASVRSEKLKREDKTTKAAPALAAGHRLVLGENVHAGRQTQVTLSPDQRVRHTYVIGASGTGKSTLLLNLILQDIRNGEGVGVLDPHGDLIDQILGHVPEERFKDVVLLDPGDADYPVGFNVLSAHSELEKNLIASDLVAGFRRLSTSWGDQMTSVLGNAVLAFLESERGGTLADLRRFLIEPEFRRQYLPTVRDPEVIYYWQKEFPVLAGKPQAPLLTRLDTFLRPKVIRHMVAQRENRLDFAGIMNEGKIFLAKLAQGAIGEENAYLLGTLLVSKFQQLAMARQETEESARRPFYLYIDEFQNFITPSMAAILAAARKYRLGLVLAHQDLRQLSKDADLFGAIMSNPYTRICFRVGDQDARKLAEGLSSFDAKDLQNLGIGEAICRIERAEYDFNLKAPPLPEVDMALARQRKERIVILSREKYAVRREEVEALLSRQTVAEPAVPPPREVPQDRKAPRPGTSAAAPPRAEANAPPLPRPQVAPTPGRGGQQHKYLQQLIKRWAESRGWRATVEKQVLDGLGSVDVALEKEDLSVGCEITMTTSPEHELANLQKCLAAGFSHVAVISTDTKALKRVRDLAATLDEPERERVHFFTAEELFAFLGELDARAAAKEETVMGYKVKVRYQGVGEVEQKVKRQAISQIILQAVRRLKGGRE